MDTIPENQVTMQDLTVWYKLTEELARVRAAEAILRPKIYKHFFPNAKEGVNDFVLPDGYILKGTRTINREVDAGALAALQPKFDEAKIVIGNLIRNKPELKIGEYRKLTAEELKLIDQALIIKDGMPQMKIVPPSTRSKGAKG